VIKRGPQKQRGVALLAALILMLAVVLILTNIFYRHQIDVSQASASLHGDQALLIAISGEGWAGELLSDKNDNRNVDDYGEIWAQAMPLLPVEGGTLKAVSVTCRVISILIVLSLIAVRPSIMNLIILVLWVWLKLG